MNNLDDHEFATYLATETGKRLVELRASLVDQGVWGWDLKDAGDAMAQEYLMAQLREFRPDDAVLSEEALDTSKRLSAERVWIIDPLDGTQEFSEPDRNDWAVHVALWQRDKNHGSLIAAAVSLPAIEMTLSTNPPPAPPVKHDGPPRLVVSRTRTPREAVIVAEASAEAVALELAESAFWDAEQATTLSAMTIEPATAIINFFMLNMPLLLVTNKRHPQAL